MTTKRTPRILPFGKRITSIAVRAFREMEQIKAAGCDCPHDCRDGHCERWRQLDRTLRSEMRLPPWEYPSFGARLVGHCDAKCVARYEMLRAAADAAEATAE
jgi:hypothetical protein